MNKFINLTTILLIICLVLTACGGEKTYKVFPFDGDTEIFGNLKDNIIVSKKDPAVLSIDNDNKTIKIIIPIELTKSIYGDLDNYEFFIGAQIYDKGEERIEFEKDNYEFIANNLYNDEKQNLSTIEELKAFLSKSKGAKTNLEIKLVLNNLPNNINEMLSKAKFYMLECEKEEKGKYNFDDDDYYDDDYDTPSYSNKTNQDWDNILDSYENYIEEYIKLLKKANSGDMSALIEYMEYMEKAMDLAEKMEDAEGEMNATQATRFTKLQAKLANAAANM